MRHADTDADGAHMDGTNGMDTAGVNGEGTVVDGANGGSGGGFKSFLLVSRDLKVNLFGLQQDICSDGVK